MKLIDEIGKKKDELDRKRQLPVDTLKSLQDKVFLEWTYHSNAIEGNTLTLKETKVVLEGITVGGKSLREHLEVINHYDAITYIGDLIKEKEPLSESIIKNIHRLVLKGINIDYAGRYRNQNVLISGAEHIPPEHFDLPSKMKEFIDWYHNEGVKLHSIERTAKVHGIFVKIHPFIGENGRIARLLMNFELMKEGYPPTILRNGKRLEYYTALDNEHITNDYSDFVELIASEVGKSLDLYLKYV